MYTITHIIISITHPLSSLIKTLSAVLILQTTTLMYEMIADMRSWQQEIEDKVVTMDQRCANVEAYMRQLQISIRTLPEVVARKLQRPESSNASMKLMSVYDGNSQPPSGTQSIENQVPGSEYSSLEAKL